MSVHLSPWSPEHRLGEAALIAQNIGKVQLGIAAGDFNAVPPGDVEPPWDDIPRYKRSQTIVDGDGVRADRSVGQRLERAGPVDAARAYADRAGEEPMRTGDRWRCDQIWRRRVAAWSATGRLCVTAAGSRDAGQPRPVWNTARSRRRLWP